MKWLSEFSYCRICFCFARGRLYCEECAESLERSTPRLRLDRLEPLEGRVGYRRVALFYYEGCVRQLLLRIKVKSDFAALHLVRQLVLSASEAIELVEWADVIVPAPSSLWGRLRGRIDIAEAIAFDLSVSRKRRFVSAPWQLHWRTYKRAKIKRNLRTSAMSSGRTVQWLARAWQNYRGRLLRGKKILLIDDISTTGLTLLETVKALETIDPDEVRLLVVAMPRPNAGLAM